jgi:hypothetical protein
VSVPRIAVVPGVRSVPGTVKVPLLVSVPPGVVTLIVPVVAPVGTVVVILVEPFTVKVAAVPWNFTEVAPVKPVPLMVTLVPTAPLVGVKEVIVGGVVTVKLVELVPVPCAVVTLMVRSWPPWGQWP